MLLDEAARRAGGHRWVEGRLFEILGGWVASTAEVRCQAPASTATASTTPGGPTSGGTGLPVLAGIDRGRTGDRSVTRNRRPDPSAGIHWRATFPDWRAPTVSPCLAWSAPIRRHRLNANPASDDAAMRTLDIVLPDLIADWRHGEVLLQRLLNDQRRVVAAADTVANLERLLVGEMEGLSPGN